MNARMPALTALLVIVAATALSAPGLAGTVTDPEITDPVDDACTGSPSGCAAPQDFYWPAVDMLHAWIAENDTHLQFHIQMKAGAPHSGYGPTGATGVGATATYEYAFSATVNGAAKVAKATLKGGTPTGDVITPSGVATGASMVGNNITLDVPKSALGAGAGSVVGGLFVTATGKSAAGQTLAMDRAPDAGSGRDYLVLSGAAAPGGGGAASNPVTYQDVSDAKLSVRQAFTNSTNATYQYNWTKAPSHADITFLAKLTSGKATVTIVDPTGHQVWGREATGNDTANESVTGASGTWTVRVEFSNATGSIDLGAQQSAASSSGAPATTPTSNGPASTTGTSTAATTGAAGATTTTAATTSGTPGLTLPLIVVGFVVALFVARRR